MQIILTYHYNSSYDIYTYIYTHLFILFPFHPGLVFGKKNPKPILPTSPEIHLEVQVVDHLLVHLLVDPEKGLAVVVAVALVGPTAAVVVVDTVCHGSACGFFTGIFWRLFRITKNFQRALKVWTRCFFWK